MPRPCVSHRRRPPPLPHADRRPAGRRPSALPGLCLAGLLVALLWGCSSTPPKPPSALQALARTSSERAANALRRGDLPQSQAQYQIALNAAVALQDPALAGAALLNLTLVASRLGQVEAGHAHVDQILHAPQFYPPPWQAQAAARKALLLLDSATPASARPWIDRAQAGCASPCAMAALLANLRAHLALGQGEPALALAQAQAAASLAQASQQASEQATALRLQARAGASLGQTGAALLALSQALVIDRQLGQPEPLALTLVLTAEMHARQGQAGLAADHYQRAIDVYTAIGDARQADQLRQRLGPVPR